MDLENFRVKPVWSKSKEDIWVEKFEPLVEQNESKGTLINNRAEESKIFLRRIPLWGYAASLLIPVLLFCQLFTVTQKTTRGEQTVLRLPDRSTVTLNAETKLSYKPLVWFISRKVRLDGEACFEVKPGSRFSVRTDDNRVSVLGTTFNVQARPGIYRVTCLTGQVEVQAGQETFVLNPNMQASLHEHKLIINSDVTPAMTTGWMQGVFVFVETPLQEVVAEVERQYNIQVTPTSYPNHLYSGNFSKTDNRPEEVLEIIGKPFGITFSIK